MDIKNIPQSWKNFVSKMNEQGVPIPMVRYKSEGNPALTLVFVSAAIVVVGIVGKWSGRLGGIDMASAMQFFYASSTLFFGHSWVHKDAQGNIDKMDGNPPVQGP
jgi:hypothetical protein